ELIESRELLVSKQKYAESERRVAALVNAGISESLAKRSIAAAELALALPIIDAADKSDTPPARVAKVFSAVAGTLGLDWLTDQLGQLPAGSHWQSMERDSLLDDITTYQGVLAAHCLAESDGDVKAWLSSHGRFAGDWTRVLEDAQHASVQDFSMFSMTCRKLGDLCRSI
ncbi:MAG: NAD-glutamate dehydrogenase, partial [Gammaproteobacteria bacterium]|nr:NAD-glutamate dehydrogenase [Gammaproteobacteria bacterium]